MSETKANPNEDIISCGDYIIIRRTHERESSRLIKAETNKPVFLGKQRINLDGIFGHRFGSTFEIDKNRNLNLVNIRQLMDSSLDLPQITSESDQQKDNRFVLDDGKSQKLSHNQIESLKSQFNSNEIIENLVKNSSTFGQKTSFAQQKYLKKKQKKYSNLVTILRPNVRLLTEMYFSRGPQKIDYLRIDSLSQMLSFCNVMSGRRYIVLDTNLGILTAAVVERLGSEGNVIQVYTEAGPVSTYRQAVDALNLPKETVDKMLFGLQVNEVFRLLHKDNDSLAVSSQKQIDCDKQSEEVVTTDVIDNTLKPNNEKLFRKEMRRKEKQKASEILDQKNIDGLLFLSKSYDPLNILLLMLEFMSDSRPFAVFSPYVQPLSKCYFELKKRAVFLRITETWVRKYQVLPDRTRPEMTMSSSSGYLLTGIKVSHNCEQME